MIWDPPWAADAPYPSRPWGSSQVPRSLQKEPALLYTAGKMAGNLQGAHMKLRDGVRAGKIRGAHTQSREAGGEEAKVKCELGKRSLEKCAAGCRLTCAQQGSFCAAKTGPAFSQPRVSLCRVASVRSEIRLDLQARGGGLARKERIGPGSRFIKSQGCS